LSEAGAFTTLIDRLRRGDNLAAAELLREYEPVLRRIIGMRLADSRVRRLHDADDIFQSVFGSFFVRMALGQYDIGSQEDLLKLLATMVRNKVVNKQRRRSLENQEELRVPLDRQIAQDGSAPGDAILHEELLRKAALLLSSKEQELVALRKQGLEWGAIAERLGSTPEGLRKRLARAVDLVVKQLGLDDTCRT
jgi:RNA polymerase sigma factor (sigma-70 family)